MSIMAVTHGLLADFDYYGAAALVAAVGAIVSSILAFLAQSKAKTVAQHTENIQAAVSTSNGYTVGELAERTAAVVTGATPPAGSITELDPHSTP